MLDRRRSCPSCKTTGELEHSCLLLLTSPATTLSRSLKCWTSAWSVSSLRARCRSLLTTHLHQNDKGKNWRHVFKSLTLLDYCLHAGSENVVQYFRCVDSALVMSGDCLLGLHYRENIYIVKTLKEFQYIDEFGKDQGANGQLFGARLRKLGRANLTSARSQFVRRPRTSPTSSSTNRV